MARMPAAYDGVVDRQSDRQSANLQSLLGHTEIEDARTLPSTVTTTFFSLRAQKSYTGPATRRC